MKIVSASFLLFLSPLLTAATSELRSLASDECAKEGEACVDPDSLQPNDCCKDLKGGIAKSDDGRFIPICMPSKVAQASAKELLRDHRFKQQTCLDLEVSLETHYESIAEILKELDNSDPEDNPMGLQVETLCKNSDKNDPGLRDLASFTRFDYIVKCSQADMAYCRFMLAEAVKSGQLLFRQNDVSRGKINYMTKNAKEVEKMKKSGYNVEFDCDYLEEPPFVYKPLSFDANLLKKTCGKAGYEAYVE